ncbi:MAG: hypothetical protein ACP5H3_04055 [Candidatus Aenigmatarchaeota archaeon]
MKVYIWNDKAFLSKEELKEEIERLGGDLEEENERLVGWYPDETKGVAYEEPVAQYEVLRDLGEDKFGHRWLITDNGIIVITPHNYGNFVWISSVDGIEFYYEKGGHNFVKSVLGREVEKLEKATGD